MKRRVQTCQCKGECGCHGVLWCGWEFLPRPGQDVCSRCEAGLAKLAKKAEEAQS